jgi:hypothetical protein
VGALPRRAALLRLRCARDNSGMIARRTSIAALRRNLAHFASVALFAVGLCSVPSEGRADDYADFQALVEQGMAENAEAISRFKAALGQPNDVSSNGEPAWRCGLLALTKRGVQNTTTFDMRGGFLFLSFSDVGEIVVETYSRAIVTQLQRSRAGKLTQQALEFPGELRVKLSAGDFALRCEAWHSR